MRLAPVSNKTRSICVDYSPIMWNIVAFLEFFTVALEVMRSN